VLFHGAVAERVGLHPTDEKAMSLLEREGPITAGDVARRTALTSGSVTALLDRLEAKGFVIRARDPADRRRVVVAAAPEAVARFGPLFRSTRRSLDRLWTRYNDAELAVILDFLTRNARRLREETGRLG
jgi:DNA-binding MarR family transcriptional regulator